VFIVLYSREPEKFWRRVLSLSMHGWLEAESKCSITAFTLALDATNRLLTEIDDSLDAIKVAIGKK